MTKNVVWLSGGVSSFISGNSKHLCKAPVWISAHSTLDVE